MGLLDLVQRRGRELELDSGANPAGWLTRLDQTGAGVEVNDTTAMNFLALYACVSLLADSVGSLPCKVFKRSTTGAQDASDHPAAELVGGEFNSETTAMVGRQVVQIQALLGGYGYAEIERDGGSRPLALWPIDWRRITPRRHPVSGELLYDVAPYTPTVLDGSPRQGKSQGGQIPDQDMLRIPGLSLAGLRAISPVAVAREVIGAGLASDRWLASFFGNGAWPGGWIKTKKAFRDEDAKKKFLESVNARHQGAQRAFRIGLLEDDADFMAATIPAKDAQLLELKVDLRREIARLYRVPLHMIGDLERATFSNIEEQGLEFVTYSLLPWLVKWEQELRRKLLTAAERKTHYFKFNAAALLRGNAKGRYEAYSSAITAGWMSPDEARDLEEMNPIPGGKGKVWLFPLNAEQIGAGKAPAKRNASRALLAFSQLLPDEAARARHAVVARALREIDRGAGAPLERLLSVWDGARADARRVLTGPLSAACRAAAIALTDDHAEAELIAERSAARLAIDECDRMVQRLRALAEAAHVGADGDSRPAVRAALAAEQTIDQQEAEGLLQRVATEVATQIWGEP